MSIWVNLFVMFSLKSRRDVYLIMTKKNRKLTKLVESARISFFRSLGFSWVNLTGAFKARIESIARAKRK